MENGFWKIFAETGDPMEYLMCVSLEKAEAQNSVSERRIQSSKKPLKQDGLPPAPEA